MWSSTTSCGLPRDCHSFLPILALMLKESLLALALFLPVPLLAGADAVRIGVLTDMSGSMAASAGIGSVEAAQMAVDDAGGALAGKPIIVINADYRNRGDLAKEISQQWIDRQQMDVVVDVPNAAIATRLQPIFREKNRLLLSTCPSRDDVRGGACSGGGLSWLYDRDTLVRNLVAALIAEKRKRWFILSDDEAHNLAFVKNVKAQLKALGGEAVGEAELGARLQGVALALEHATSTKADVLFLALERPDLIHLMRHWPAGTPSMPLALAGLSLGDVRALSHENPPPFFTTAPFYWAQDEATRNWAEAFARRARGQYPGDIHAGVYSSVRHYLASRKALGADGADSAEALLAHMREHPLNDPLFGPSRMRGDGLMLHRLHLLQLKPDNERQGPWDFFRIVRTLAPPELLLPQEIVCEKK